MTDITLPRRVDIKTGAKMTPTGINAREDCVWVEGSFDNMGEATRKKFAHKIADLREKQKALAKKRKVDA